MARKKQKGKRMGDFDGGRVAHQGDILIRYLGKKSKKTGTPVTEMFHGMPLVLKSETLGNQHVIEDAKKADLKLIKVEDAVQEMLLQVKEETRMIHVNNEVKEKGHDAITFQPGDYEIRTQREKQAGFLRRVSD